MCALKPVTHKAYFFKPRQCTLWVRLLFISHWHISPPDQLCTPHISLYVSLSVNSIRCMYQYGITHLVLLQIDRCNWWLNLLHLTLTHCEIRCNIKIIIIGMVGRRMHLPRPPATKRWRIHSKMGDLRSESWERTNQNTQEMTEMSVLAHLLLS